MASPFTPDSVQGPGATTANPDVVVGNVASDAPDSGAPVKIGGVYNNSRPSVASGDRVDVQTDPAGAQHARLIIGADINSAGFGAGSGTNDSDGRSPDGNAIVAVLASNLRYNGSSWDRARGNEGATLLASAARTATTSSADQTNYDGLGAIIVVNTTVEGAATLTLTVQGKDSISGSYYDLITGIVVYTAAADTPPIIRAVALHPGVLTADCIGAGNANLISQKAVMLPRVWRATITPADANSTTYSVSAVTLR